LCIASYEYLFLTKCQAFVRGGKIQLYVQYALEFFSGARVKKEICTAQVAFKGVIRCTSSNESLVDGGMFGIPAEPVFAAGMSSVEERMTFLMST
jgi:hypothetical protein